MRKENRSRLRPLLNIAQQFYLTRRLVAASLALILVVVTAEVTMPWLAKIVIDMITEAPKSNVDAVFNDVLLVCGVLLGVALLQYITAATLNRMYNRAVYRGSAKLRERLYALMQAQSLNFLAERQIGEILTHLMSDIQNLQDSTLDLASEVPFDVCTLIGVIVAMLILNPHLALIVILVLGASVIFALGIGRRGWDAQNKVMEGTADLTAHIQEGLAAARTLATFDAHEQEQQRLAEASHRHAAHMEKSGAIGAAVTPLLSFAEYAGIVVVLIFGGWAMLHGSLTAGGLVAFLAYMQLSADPMSRFSRVIPRLQKATVSAARLHNLLNETPVIKDKPHALTVSYLNGDVSAEHLHFHYPSSAQAALADIHFDVKAGERVAIVGRNASGKSTLLDLLLRIQEPDQGRLLADGMDLRDVRRANWRSFIGVVPQDIFLLNRSVVDNIALGSTASAQEIRRAAEAAGIANFIEQLPQGYDTLVGERGLFLSGGERQRIAIARLFLREPRIVLLDEPTSALDVSYERDLLPALHKLCAGKTTFIVSHRLAVLTEVDKVLLLDAGKQLAFDQPHLIWRDFPAFRDLFPEPWASTAPNSPVALDTVQETYTRDQREISMHLNGIR